MPRKGENIRKRKMADGKHAMKNVVTEWTDPVRISVWSYIRGCKKEKAGYFMSE